MLELASEDILSRIREVEAHALESLDLSGLGLRELPNELFAVSQLRTLDISDNYLAAIPKSIGNLVRLEYLAARNNALTDVPSELEKLTRLESLDLSNNQLTKLPVGLSRLSRLVRLVIHGNAIDLGGVDLENQPARLLSFLNHRREGRQRYEAKLILLGHGAVGKTCLSRALRGEPFEHQTRTRGVNVHRWLLPTTGAPGARSPQVTLNIWDFEGQEINHQSHQFFLTRRSIYLVVFNGRDESRTERLEYWLDMIRARAPGCIALLVGTQCEDTEPRLDVRRLCDRYGAMLPSEPLFAVGSVNGRGIGALVTRLGELATGLTHLPWQWPPAYDRAERAVNKLSDERTYLNRQEFDGLLDSCDIDSKDYDMVADLFSDVGIITHFGDNYELRDFVVLKPQWLTHAISLALDNPELVQERGKLELNWLSGLWERAYPGMFGRFYSCMKHFELCYPLETSPASALVPLRFDPMRPEIPWVDVPNSKERRIVYRFELRPPVGLISRFIVKTHHLIVRTVQNPNGVYWRNGVFLQHGSGESLSQALCTWDDERRALTIVVRAAFPQKMVEQLDFVASAVFAFYQGICPVRYFGCVFSDESPCPGDHPERRVAFHLKRDMPILCDAGMHEIRPRQLLEGLNMFGRAAAIRDVFLEESDRLAQLMGTGLFALQERMSRLEGHLMVLGATAQDLPAVIALQVQQAHQQLLHALDAERVHRIPSLFTVFPVRTNPLDVRYLFKSRFVLHLYCENEMPHFGSASWEFERPQDWWHKTGPILVTVFSYLQLLAKPGVAALRLALGEENQKSIAAEVELMKCVIEGLPTSVIKESTTSNHKGPSQSLEDASVIRARTALSELMAELDPIGHEAGVLGDLRRYRLPDNSYRWLCERHARQHGIL